MYWDLKILQMMRTMFMLETDERSVAIYQYLDRVICHNVGANQFYAHVSDERLGIAPEEAA